ncbi:4-(cytidine 5'-diphospho)-2-C-methyl-D-erythritol kinase [Corynebacterium godavarianum]|uniref:4-diphosphocytidyl-2-C-methyl-D-erythritol kinase n=2 Tax=Corynebacterium TaxID=1716 RepID=A0ABY3E753_9CORY|nr:MULTISPECIES: 4-(cytidine 5'-diphospho)-2-C-methyl-D-erythritol kinase [Corynebacterium]MBL7285486.1 4-(cytidine 5'-diphospho)-2-C-methyl-D-erythritol kinase [Corynebacterium godavarianum]PAJ70001.1 4-(cytidine 5'-diphospho)-2-C-methyl-D-erythritol kinase [Corynebacterium hadale]TSJ75651.1 4-(cytidine 5'-diphospho)-2-C-methyl-D-erythritol kinase [Corynebacterium godavarianum]WKC59683.1 4-diphosphocytidyl-2-C-methyl-D-erythritol kinase [Corynebacterium hadale]
MSNGAQRFSASAPGKVNLHLGVGEARSDGYHDLVSVFQAVDRRETVTLVVQDAPPVSTGSVVTGMTTTFGVRCPEEHIDAPFNLAWRAVDAVVDEYRRSGAEVVTALPPVHIEVDKQVFVAGGMAGGSADAAAALVAADAYLAEFAGSELGRDTLHRLAAQLGADVPFSLMGGTALGTGRGDELVEMLTRGSTHWVFLNPKVGIPTGQAFGLLDDLRHNDPALVPRLGTATVARALTRGDAHELGRAMHNDLEAAATTMRPILVEILAFAGALPGVARSMVSGSGPTIALLCRDAAAAEQVLGQVRERYPDYESFGATGPSPGAQAAQ